MAPRIAKSLAKLRDQVNAQYPGRSTTSDGWIGDAKHRATQSEHNPDNNGVVRALDITHDPHAGVYARQIADSLLKSRDPRILYMISNGQMVRFYKRSGTTIYRWAPYYGQNPHTLHAHISVVDDPKLYDSTRPWALPEGVEPLPAEPEVYSGITATVFNDTRLAYSDVPPGHLDRPGCALPFRFLGRRPKVLATYKGNSVVCDIHDVGPWTINDPYWETGARPQAEREHLGLKSGPNAGKKTNKAGIDLNPKAANILKLPGKGLIDWRFLTEAEERKLVAQQ